MATSPRGSPLYSRVVLSPSVSQRFAQKLGKSLDDHLSKSAVWLPRPFDRLFQAFDIAWPKLTPLITDRGLSNDNARRQLADAILLFAEGDRSAAEIAKAALQKLGI